MSEKNTSQITLWDLPTRLFHWLLVGMMVALWITGELGRLGVHMILGQCVLALVLFRLIWGVVGSRSSRFAHFVKGPGAILAYVRQARAGTAHVLGHNPLGALSVLALLALAAVQAGTGLFTTDDVLTEGPLAALVSSKISALLSSLHRNGFVLLLVFVGLHVAAVLFYRFVKKDDLVTPMITGRKEVPRSQAGEGVTFAGLGLAAAVAVFSAAVVFGGLKLVVS